MTKCIIQAKNVSVLIEGSAFEFDAFSSLESLQITIFDPFSQYDGCDIEVSEEDSYAEAFRRNYGDDCYYRF